MHKFTKHLILLLLTSLAFLTSNVYCSTPCNVPNCSSCNGNMCNECKNGFFKAEDGGPSVVDSCESCKLICNTCNGPEDNDCLSCPSGYELKIENELEATGQCKEKESDSTLAKIVQIGIEVIIYAAIIAFVVSIISFFFCNKKCKKGFSKCCKGLGRCFKSFCSCIGKGCKSIFVMCCSGSCKPCQGNRQPPNQGRYTDNAQPRSPEDGQNTSLILQPGG